MDKKLWSKTQSAANPLAFLRGQFHRTTDVSKFNRKDQNYWDDRQWSKDIIMEQEYCWLSIGQVKIIFRLWLEWNSGWKKGW